MNCFRRQWNTVIGIFAGLDFVWLVARHPELWEYWKGVAIAMLLTAATCGVAILLSGQYKQSNCYRGDSHDSATEK